MNKPYNLEDRTKEFSIDIIRLCKKIKKDTIDIKIIDQLVRSACSVGANCREANEALSKKDFIHRMKITRKECKESTYWLELLYEANKSYKDDMSKLKDETIELRNIFSSIIDKSK